MLAVTVGPAACPGRRRDPAAVRVTGGAAAALGAESYSELNVLCDSGHIGLQHTEIIIIIINCKYQNCYTWATLFELFESDPTLLHFCRWLGDRFPPRQQLHLRNRANLGPIQAQNMPCQQSWSSTKNTIIEYSNSQKKERDWKQ